jgi:hypothetical protein
MAGTEDKRAVLLQEFKDARAELTANLQLLTLLRAIRSGAANDQTLAERQTEDRVRRDRARFEEASERLQHFVG